MPVVIRHGVIEDSPNLAQIKGMRLADDLTKALAAKGVSAPVYIANDADAIAKRFSSKGYSAYVEVPPNGTGTVFRVRIGTFKTKREAETIAAKLQKEEQIKPWVTR